MAYEPKPGDGALFANKGRSKDTQPNATGYVIAHRDIRAGERLRLAAWTKEGAKGKFQSLKLSDDQRQQDRPVADSAPATAAGPDDDLPF